MKKMDAWGETKQLPVLVFWNHWF